VAIPPLFRANHRRYGHKVAYYRTLPAIGMPSAQGYSQLGEDFHRWDRVISLDKS
jgi:hypothetical protein